MKNIHDIRLENARILASTFKNLADFAEKIERAPTQVSRFMGKNPTKHIGDKLARHLEEKLNMATGWLDREHGTYLAEGPQVTGIFPLISWEQALDWPANKNSLQDTVTYPCLAPCSEESFVLKVQGISMEPVFNEGELIFVDPNVTIKTGNYVVASLAKEPEPLLRKLIVESGKNYLHTTNPDWPSKIIQADSNCKFLGTVVFSGRFF